MQRESSREAGALADVVVVDYGLGNLRSVSRGLERAGAAVEVSDDPAAFDDADGVVLPGVGAFREGMENAEPYRDALVEVAESDAPLFGICLGMQMLLSGSEEAHHEGQGAVEGLGFVPGTNVRFRGAQKVPHMGWNELRVVRDHPLVTGVDDAGPVDDAAGAARDGPERGGSVGGDYAYFVHSYYADPENRSATVTTTEYGTTFPSIVADDSGTVFGTQFHPEKSGETGLAVLENFVDMCR